MAYVLDVVEVWCTCMLFMHFDGCIHPHPHLTWPLDRDEGVGGSPQDGPLPHFATGSAGLRSFTLSDNYLKQLGDVDPQAMHAVLQEQEDSMRDVLAAQGYPPRPHVCPPISMKLRGLDANALCQD